MAIMGRDPFGISKEGEVHTISYKAAQQPRNLSVTAAVATLQLAFNLQYDPGHFQDAVRIE
jgi:hypothetical protein